MEFIQTKVGKDNLARLANARAKTLPCRRV